MKIASANTTTAKIVFRSEDAILLVELTRKTTGKLAYVMPRTRTEMYRFRGVALIADFCEEFVLRRHFHLDLCKSIFTADSLRG
jgi:hypothetical protein